MFYTISWAYALVDSPRHLSKKDLAYVVTELGLTPRKDMSTFRYL